MERSGIFQAFFCCSIFLSSCRAGLTGPTQREEMQMTDQQLEEFEKFKVAVLPHAPNNWMKLDIGLVKFFTEAGRNAEAATTLYKSALKKRLDADNYNMSDEIRDFGKSMAPRESYVDKFGRPVAFFKAKRTNFTLALSNETVYKMGVQYLWGSFEENMDRLLVDHEKKKSFAYVILIDLKDANPREMVNDKGIALFATLQDEVSVRFPRCWHLFFVVNAPPAFEMSVAILKTTMPEYTKSVYYFYSDDDTLWSPLVQQFIDLESLPDLYMKSKDPELASTGGAGGAPGPASPLAGAMMPFPAAPLPMSPPVPEKGGGGPKKKSGKKKGKKLGKGGAEEDDYDNEE